jgi:hypothetical protein
LFGTTIFFKFRIKNYECKLQDKNNLLNRVLIHSDAAAAAGEMGLAGLDDFTATEETEAALVEVA